MSVQPCLSIFFSGKAAEAEIDHILEHDPDLSDIDDDDDCKDADFGTREGTGKKGGFCIAEIIFQCSMEKMNRKKNNMKMTQRMRQWLWITSTTKNWMV